MFIEKYIGLHYHVVEQYYKTIYEINPEAFPILDRKNIKFFIYRMDPQHFHETNYLIYFVHTRSKIDTYNFRDNIEIQDLTKVGEYGQIRFFKYLLHKLDNIDYKDILKVYNVNNVYHSVIQDILDSTIQFDNLSSLMKNQLKHEFDSILSNFRQHNNHPNGYYAKNAYKYAFSDFNLEEIIKQVNNEDFEYAINEAIACFDNSLYLAGCAALGVAFETAALELLKKKDIKIYGSAIKDYRNGGLGRYNNELFKLEVISLKTHQRINKVCLSRNMASHASSGKVVKGDFKSMVTDLIDFIHSSFQ